MAKRKDRTGLQYGRLQVTAFSHVGAGRKLYWHCLCNCGTPTVVMGDNLERGLTRSCGCLRQEVTSAHRRTHGHRYALEGKRTPTASSYHNAKSRSTNRNHPDYPDYGGRGIEFRFDGVEALLAEIGERPDGLSIDRIDVDGHYESGNVRWADSITQANNKRS